MINIFIVWQQPNYTPDHVWLHISNSGGGPNLNAQYPGTTTSTMVTANSGDILHIEIFNSVSGVDSPHVTIDFTVP